MIYWKENIIKGGKNKMRVRRIVHEALEQLCSLGIDALQMEDTIVDGLSSIDEERERENIIGLTLDYVALNSGDHAPFANKIYAFDSEVADIDGMFTVFLNEIQPLVGDDVTITDISEEVGPTDTHTIRFRCNGKVYQHECAPDHDWFDPDMFSFVNYVLDQQGSGKYLLVTGDLGQNYILFYNTEEWAQRFRDCMQYDLVRP